MPRSRTVTLLAGACMALLLSACGTTDFRRHVETEAVELRKGPQARPMRTVTGFTDALRCMDSMLAAYGVRDVPVLVEDVQDQTKKISVGARDMLISAVHEASARSQAIKLITFGADVGNLANFHANAESKKPYENVPVYDIRGSISQLDEGVSKKQAEGGITLGPFGVGAAKTGDGSIVALDLSVISASDYSLVPGVKASNSVLIYKEGVGVDADVEYKKLGLNFGMTLSRNEGKAQAVRALIELAVVELLGKLAKVPYWTCLGADPNNEEVRHEITTWLYSMQANDELVGYFQRQLTLRGLYSGPIDGESNEAFMDGLVRLRSNHGLSAEAVIDLELLSAYLATDHRTSAPLRVAFSRPTAAAPATAAPAKAAELKLELVIQGTRFRPGEEVKLTATPNSDAHVYCYLQDAARKIVRFYPNRFAPNPRVAAHDALLIPGKMRFQITAPARGGKEIVACFATARDVARQLPAEVYATDFEPLNVGSLDEIHAAFSKVTRESFALGVVHVESK
jgi:curli biogenesis system outer membrane secretion channel CsgG